MKKFLFLTALIFLFGCTTTQKGAGIGAVAGGALGGVIGHQSGRGGTGAAIGAAVGGIGGALIGEKMENKFCPVCGKHYTSDVEYCPEDGTKLQEMKK